MKYLASSIINCRLAILLLHIVILTSCSKMDDYKKYFGEGEISYTGKIDSLRIYSGNNRVLVTGLLISDPKIVSAKIYWDNKTDSVEVPITRSSGVDTLKQYINKIVEGTHSFEIVTFDKFGNHSISVFGTGTVYSDRFQQGLLNRPIAGSELNTNLDTKVSFAGMDLTSGVFATQVRYLNTSGDTSKMTVPIGITDTVLLNHKYGSKFIYRTLYRPDTLCIDTFYTGYSTYQPVSGSTWVDQTTNFLKNPGNQFTYSSINSGNRWGILADWTTTADVKNASGFGGYEKRNNVGVLSMEGGWGLPAVPNGKIYQTINLPFAGKWRFEALVSDNGNVGTKYIAQTFGSSLPDVGNVPTEANAFYNFSLTPGNTTVSFEFTLSQPSTVTVGFVGNLPSTGSYYKVKSVKLSYYKE